MPPIIEIQAIMNEFTPYILTGVSLLLVSGMILLAWQIIRFILRNRAVKPRTPWISAFILAILVSSAVSNKVQEWWQERLLDQIEQLPPTGAGLEITKPSSISLFKPLTHINESFTSIDSNPEKVITGRSRNTGIDLDAMSADILELDLFDDTTFKAIRNRKIEGLVPTLEGGKAWVGHVENEPESEVILIAKGPVISGTIDVGSKNFEVVFVKDGVHSIREIDQNQIPKTFEPDLNSIVDALREGYKQQPPTSSGIDRDTGEVLDILVAYTPKSRINAGGVSAIEARILNAVVKTQQAYLNSKANMHLNVVHMAETDYIETGDLALTHTRLANPKDGYLDDIPLLRDQFGADVVILFSTENNYCSVTPLMGEPESGFQSMAYILVHDDSTSACLGGNDALAHAFGHLHGVTHELEDTSFSGILPDAHGYRICGIFRDVMSSSCQNESRASVFSNPEIQYMGQPAGVNGVINATRAILVSAPLIANFRQSPAAFSPPNLPADLRAFLTHDSSIGLHWKDESSNEVGFTIYRSVDGHEWQEIATLASNHVNYMDTTVKPDSTYQYRVEAWNSVGSSGYTNPVEIVTVRANAILNPTPNTWVKSASSI